MRRYVTADGAIRERSRGGGEVSGAGMHRVDRDSFGANRMDDREIAYRIGGDDGGGGGGISRRAGTGVEARGRPVHRWR